jgi:hypothetical protein
LPSALLIGLPDVPDLSDIPVGVTMAILLILPVLLLLASYAVSPVSWAFSFACRRRLETSMRGGFST